MLDNLRNQAAFEPEQEPAPIRKPDPPKAARTRRNLDQVTGMSAGQRLVLAIMLLAMVCLMGFILLMVLGYIVPPFLF